MILLPMLVNFNLPLGAKFSTANKRRKIQICTELDDHLRNLEARSKGSYKTERTH